MIMTYSLTEPLHGAFNSQKIPFTAQGTLLDRPQLYTTPQSPRGLGLRFTVEGLGFTLVPPLR